MLQNKIYQNYFKEIYKNFFVVLFSFSIIAWVVKAVNYLDLIVENGYSIFTYLSYSFLGLTSIITKFIPLSFLIVIVHFISKQIEEKEFTILWSAGVKKITLVNLFLLISIAALLFYLIFSLFITPYSLNKSRNLLSKKSTVSIMPTIKKNQFSDNFKGLTIIVDDKIKNEIKNIFIFDESENFKHLNSNKKKKELINIISENGIIEENQMILINGQIISSNFDNLENRVVKFNQMNIDLSNLENTVIKKPKIQETSTFDLLKCFNKDFSKDVFCSKKDVGELVPTLNRRITLPFYIPIISLICCFLFLQSSNRKIYNNFIIFILSFIILLFAELIIRYTGLNKNLNYLFIIVPLALVPILYIILNFKFKSEVLLK